MTHKIIPYQRYWHNSGEVLPLDENGFLVDPTVDWFNIYYQEKDVYTLSDLIQFECLLLLGEPGIGKSTELEKVESEERDKQHIKNISFTLRRFESKRDLKETVFNDVTVADWISGNNEPLSIYLDGLDEALLDAKKISYGVIDIIKELKKYGLIFIRITCRTSDLPSEFYIDLESLFPNSLKAVELAPLRKADIDLAAEVHGIDEKVFFSSIYDKELGVLASRPVTLNMLINEFLENGKISENIEDIYEQGCMFLLEETKDRKEAGYESKLTLSQRLLIAERIAANLMLCNYSNLFTGSLTDLNAVDLNVDEIDAGEELVPDTEESVDVNKEAIDEVIRTSLFKPLSKDRFAFAHQTFAEYLTARYLIRNGFPMAQLESILLHKDRYSSGVIPQLKEVAMWLASMNKNFFQKLIDVDPVILLKSSIWVKDEGKLKALVESLIKNVNERSKGLNYLKHFKFLKNLKYNGIEKLLKAELINPEYDWKTKKFIIDIVDAIGIEDMGDELVDTALDEDNELGLRNHALEVLTELKNTAVSKDKLLPLLSSPTEIDYPLIGNAIKCLFPDLLSSEQLIEFFEQNDGIDEDILKRSGHHIIDNSDANDLLYLLDWAGYNFPEKNYPTPDSAEFFDAIILRSIKHVDDDGVKESLSRYILKKINKHNCLFTSTFSEKSYRKFKEHNEGRRLIIEEIIKTYSQENEDELPYRLRRYDQSLIVEEDFDWVLNHVLSANNEREGTLWAKVLGWSFRTYEPDQVQKILVNQYNEFIKNEFYSLITPIDITSEEAEKAKERHSDMWGGRDEPSKKKVNRKELLIKNIEELKKNNIDAFCWLDRNLSLEPDSQQYTKDWDLKSEEFDGWIKSSESLKQEIVKYAQVFLNETSPADKDWFKDVYSRASYRALRYIEDFDRELLGEISNDTWRKWLRPILYFELSGGFSLDQRFSKILNEKFQDDVIEYICELVKSENEEQSGHISVIPKLDSILSKELLDALFALLNDEDLKPRAKETIKERLLKSRHLEGLESIKSDLNRDNEDDYIINAFLLIKYSPDDFFEYVWEEFQKDTELSKKIAQKIASEDRHQYGKLKSMSEGQLAKLYIWLEKKYPVDEDSKKDGGITIRNMLSDFRSSVLNHLVTKGTEEACNQMLNILEALPDRKWLKLEFEESKEIYRRENWVPLKINHLLSLVNDKNTRIIKNEQDLLNITLEKLDDLQKRLQDQEQSESIIYWNEDPEVKPKDENRMSDLIKNYLQDSLAKEGVILNREVEIERGDKTDIHVTALISEGENYSSVKLVVEVKGCWHKDLKNAFKDQLIKKYLTDKGIRAGIYLVGWFICEKWNRGDYRFKQTPKFSFKEATDFFTNQREELVDEFPNLLIRSKVIDFSI